MKYNILAFQLEIENSMTQILKDIYLEDKTKENYDRFFKHCFKNTNKILEDFLKKFDKEEEL